MHDDVLRQAALALFAAGAKDASVAERLGVPRTTVRDWRRVGAAFAERSRCPRCWRRSRGTQRLRLSLDARYPGIVADAEALLARCMPAATAHRVQADRGATVVLQVYSSHLACLFPQHGPGVKHERSMRLEDWQWARVAEAPWAFMRGCIRSDGCAFINRTGRYRYLSYEFANRSAEILDAFSATCDLVGVEYRRYSRCVRIYRRASVALLEAHVGLKA